MPRQARKKSNTGIYHIMLRGINQQQIFEDEEDNNKFLDVIKEYKLICDYEVYAYCLMGNHIHLLIKEGEEPLGQIMKRICTRFVYWYNVKYERKGHLFQDRYKSEPVENDEYFLAVIRYIHQNPIKAGLCNNLTDYKFSSYGEYLRETSLIDKNFVLDIITLEDFKRFNSESANDKCLEDERKAVLRVTDEKAKRIIYKYSKCKSVAEFQRLPPKQIERYLEKFKENGLSLRQISRLTGMSLGKVRRKSNT